MKLLPEERDWLKIFTRGIRRSFPGRLELVMVFGSKARGEAGLHSDLDVLVILRGDGHLKSRVRLLGYELALGKDVVPSILVYTIQEFEQRKEHRSVFVEAVEREGVVVS